MELKEIAVVSGKPGLFKIVKPAKSGVILESIGGASARFIAGTSTKVSVLGEISIYTDSGNNVVLEDVFKTIYAKHGKSLPVDAKSSDNELRSFFEGIVADHDKQRVYGSDIKKVVVWYSLLLGAGFEELFAKQSVSEEVAEPPKEKKSKKVESEVAEAPKKTVNATSKKEEKSNNEAEKKAAPKAASKKAPK